jgi:hypothetical protein
LRFSLVGIIPPVFHMHSFTDHPCCIILAVVNIKHDVGDSQNMTNIINVNIININNINVIIIINIVSCVLTITYIVFYVYTHNRDV